VIGILFSDLPGGFDFPREKLELPLAQASFQRFTSSRLSPGISFRFSWASSMRRLASQKSWEWQIPGWGSPRFRRTAAFRFFLPMSRTRSLENSRARRFTWSFAPLSVVISSSMLPMESRGRSC
jgi:hypothetical protein